MFFGPQSGRATSTLKEDASEEEATCASPFSPRTRKHGRESAATGLLLDLPTTERAAKRSRRSNGTEGTIGGDDMDYELNSNSNSNSNSNANAKVNENENENATNTATANANPNGNGYPQAEAHSNASSPAEESENRSQTGVDGTNMEIDDEDAATTEQEHKHQQQEEEEEEEEEDDEDDEDEPIQALMTLTLANGQSVGVQSDKVTELGPESLILTVPDKNVLHTAWNPQDPAILATGGDALCRIWTTEQNALSSPANNMVSTPYHYVDILDASDNSFVTAMAWSPSGDVLGVATRSHTSDWTCAISLWTKSGNSMEELAAAQDMVLIFRWNPSGSHLLGITSSGRGTSALMIWDVPNSQALAPFQLDYVVTDATWSDDRKFFICGQGIIAECIIDSEIIAGYKRRDDVDKGQSLSNILYDSATQTLAFAAEESAILGIVDSSGKLHTTTAHNSEMTAVAFQPHETPSAYQSASPRLLVTASLDGHIKVWDAKNPFCIVHVFSMGRSVPAMAISFSQDGQLVAAANSDRILIWNAEEGGMPKASWKGEADTWQGPTNGVDQDSGIGEEDDGSTHSLGWNSVGGKLAYGLGSQVCVLDVSQTRKALLIHRQ